MHLARFLKSTFIYTLSQTSVQVIGLLRNAMIGHAVSPTNFGIAAVFALILSLVESLSEFSAEKLILQYKYGNSHRLISNVHFFNVVKGVFSCILIVLLQPLFLFFFELNEASWGLYVIALVPLIKGFVNVDYIRQQKKLMFKYSVIADVSAQIAALITVYVILHFYVDYKPAIFSILVHAVTFTLMSHFVSKSSYSVSFNKALSLKLLHFGWPLLLNGIALFAILQGDKFIISKVFDMEQLGYYSALSILAFIPVVISTKVLMSTLLPVYSSKQYSSALFFNYFPYLICFGYLFSTLILENILIELVFGEKYMNQGYIFKMLAVMWFFRLLQTKHVIKCIALNDTRTPFKITLIRLCFVPIAIIFINIEPKIESVVLAGVLGEISALCYLLFTTRQVQGENNVVA